MVVVISDEISSTNCLKKSSNQKCLILQNQLQLYNSYAFPKAIFHECEKQCKFEYLYNSVVYSMSDDAVYCIDCAMFLSAGETKVLRFFCKQMMKALP